jgi:hypothetical protein
MALHLIKLCVGADSIQDLEDWIELKLRQMKKDGRKPEQYHTTRMLPKRVDEILDGGSLYWVIKGQIAARQQMRDIRPFTDGEGISRCHLVLETKVIPVMPRPCRPFQGWRYLKDEEAPRDLGESGADVALMPEELRRELRELGLL